MSRINAQLYRELPTDVSPHNLRSELYFNDEINRYFDASAKVPSLDNIYDSGHREYLKQFGDINTNGSVFTKRSLEYFHAQPFKVLYGQIEYRNLFPVLNFASAGYREHTYQVLDQVGRAKLMGSDANDFPRADISGREVKAPIRAAGVGYAVSRQDMASASVANFSIITEKADACFRASEELFDDLAFIGDDDSGLVGVLNNPDINTSDVPNGGGGFPEWSTKTSDEIYEDVVECINSVWIQSKKNHRADTLVLPLPQYNILQTTRMASGTDTTIMEYLIRNIPGITMDSFVAVDQLTGAGAGGVDVMFAYAKDTRVVQYGIGLELTFLDPQFKGFMMEVPAWSTTAGLMVYRPLGFSIREKI